MTDKEIIELMKTIKEKAPNQFFETIGMMKGIKIMAEKNEITSKNNLNVNSWENKIEKFIERNFGLYYMFYV